MVSSKIIPMEKGYTAEFDQVGREEWYKIIKEFTDANIYQTWCYDAVRCGEGNISHFVLTKGEKIVAAAQARILRLPLLGLGIAYIRWGPMWQKWSHDLDPNDFRLAVRAIRNEYVCRRGLILRIFPLLYEGNSNLYIDMLLKEGYTTLLKEDQGRTLIVDISAGLDDLRKELDQKWRNCLNRAERNNLQVVEGTDDRLFQDFIGIYREMLERKRFPEPNDINEFMKIQRGLPPEFKMRIFLCQSDGTSSAGAICASIGDTGVYLFGATNEQGMTNKGSYLLQWKAVQWLKNNGCRKYNLNGINPIVNPGTYHFKAGLSGKKGKDVYYLGRFDCYLGSKNAALVHFADLIIPLLKKITSFSKLKI
jgi:hypothetical protein